MPFVDLNTKNRTEYTIPDADTVIVGAGAAGILLAVTLSKRGRKVLVLESGHFREDEEKQQLNEVVQTGKKVENAVWGRKRVIGGTTTAWGGQSLPFSPLDFSRREWVDNSGWPVSFEEVNAYYDKANAFMGIDTLNYRDDIFPKIRLKNPGIDPSIFDYHVSKWANEPNFHAIYGDYLKDNVTLLYNAHLFRIYQGEGDKVDRIEVVNFNKELFVCKPGVLIIAAGGIETVRTLLNNDLGGASGSLGKYFMEHPCLEIGKVVPYNQYSLQRHFNTHVWKSRKYGIRLSLDSQFQRRNQLLNCSASIMFMPPAQGFDPYAELRSFKRGFTVKGLIKVAGSSPDITASALAYVKNKFYYKKNAIPTLSLMIEQEPVASSYISLGKEADRFGLPKAVINWDISPKTWETAVAASQSLKTELERLRFGRVELYEHIKADNTGWSDYLSDVNHHMGGCRMSAVPEEGVVDKNLRVWGVPNLYVCSCAVFPTSSHSNPTLTLLALSMRLCDLLTKTNS